MIKWRVAEAPTGLSAVCDRRSWPNAEYDSGNHCAFIYCEMSYSLERAKSGKHPPLTLYIADYSVSPFVNRKIKVRFASLGEAKAAVWRILGKNLKMLPPQFLKD